MKRILLSLLSAMVAHLLIAQSDVKDQVTAALGSGDVNTLSEKLVANVDLTVLSTSDYYSKAQATGILRKFYEGHEPKGLRIEHEGTSKMGDRYCIGQLNTANGVFRVTFFLKKTGEVTQVKQLRIEPSNK
ncbi:MAG: DUF4783 domain-containing protein [Bacteroidetes bacterium]|nr:DUF4783 domain-containing protein [Bacteroidota bacterium]MBX7129322.1 DUF4783 domain-containing protein [Flavobacteriales bacterium]MCC6654180.1 DUF4783 domain-containing protein [Flavobacteriales bacterium]HMU12563.1 DUF4783 domain-containing protein [Flavobacteriales bacterium]HMW98170.1 DUF4783 domain-containing protein [Flavobacteriales bacterium]